MISVYITPELIVITFLLISCRSQIPNVITPNTPYYLNEIYMSNLLAFYVVGSLLTYISANNSNHFISFHI